MGRLKRFLSKRVPPLTRVLIVESGDRTILNQLLPHLYQHCQAIDLVTCFSGAPTEFAGGQIFRAHDYATPGDRQRLLNELWSQQYAAIGIVCSGQSIMTKWKWMLAAKLPGKLFLINENCDYFWVDRGQAGTVVKFVLFRAGLSGAEAAQTIMRLLFFPFTLLFLLVYATVVHLKRSLWVAFHSRH